MPAATKQAAAKPSAVKPLTQRKAWIALMAHAKKIQSTHLRQLFEDDPRRGEHFVVDALGMYFDYSKNRVTEKTM